MPAPRSATCALEGQSVTHTRAIQFVFDQIPGVQFSVGGAPGTNAPALYTLSGSIAGDATSPTTVLGPVGFDFTTDFSASSL